MHTYHGIVPGTTIPYIAPDPRESPRLPNVSRGLIVDHYNYYEETTGVWYCMVFISTVSQAHNATKIWQAQR